jgi:hypothetical protein
MAERDGAGQGRYGDWRSLELAIKDAAKKAARQAGPGISAASVDAQIRQARFDRFLSRVFVEGEQSEWLLKGGMSMLARVPRSRTTKDVDLAALRASDLAEAGRALAALADVDLGDHLTFRLIRSAPTGLGENQPGVATRRYFFPASTSAMTLRSTRWSSMSSSPGGIGFRHPQAPGRAEVRASETLPERPVGIVGKGIDVWRDAICQVQSKSGESGRHGS